MMIYFYFNKNGMRSTELIKTVPQIKEPIKELKGKASEARRTREARNVRWRIRALTTRFLGFFREKKIKDTIPI